MNSVFIHLTAIIFILVVPIFGLVLGIYQALQGKWRGTMEQPAMSKEITKMFWMGVVFIEVSVMLAFVFALIIASAKPYTELTLALAIGELAIAISIGVSLCMTSIASGGIVKEACLAIAHQPFLANKIPGIIMFLITFVEMAFLFGLLVAIIIMMNLNQNLTATQAFGMLGGGCCTAFGSIGPALGIRHFSSSVLQALGKNRNILGVIRQFCLMIILFIDMILVFAFVCAILLIYKPLMFVPLVSGVVAVNFAVVVGIVGIGISRAISRIGSISILTMAKNFKDFVAMRTLGTFVGICGCLIETSLLFAMLMVIALIIWLSSGL